MGAGHLAKTIVIEELSRVSGAVGAIAQASQLGTAKIIHFGSERQKRAWSPRIARWKLPAHHRRHRPGGRGPRARHA
ncbi:acyl-CoA dehydrogenase family protein, partial [Actinomadura adrarensis]